MILVDEYFLVYRQRKQTFISGPLPKGFRGDEAVRERSWRSYQYQNQKLTVWERADRYQRLMKEEGFHTVRAMARALGEDHSRIYRIMKVLDLPERVLESLRENSDHHQIRMQFTEKRLADSVNEGRAEADLLREIKNTVKGRF